MLIYLTFFPKQQCHINASLIQLDVARSKADTIRVKVSWLTFMTCCSSPKASHDSDKDILRLSPLSNYEVASQSESLPQARRSRRVGKQPLKLLLADSDTEVNSQLNVHSILQSFSFSFACSADLMPAQQDAFSSYCQGVARLGGKSVCHAGRIRGRSIWLFWRQANSQAACLK